jgi:hypothetical protein
MMTEPTTPTRPPRRRIWSELLPYAEVARPAVLDALASRGIELSVAVFPASLSHLGPLLADAASARVPVSLWPMIEDEQGRWASLSTMGAFLDHVARVEEALDRSGAPAAGLLFDLEPPIGRVRAALDRPSSIFARPPRPDPGAHEALDRTIARLGSRGLPATAVIWPLALADRAPRGLLPGGSHGWQRALGTPIDTPAWNRVDTMLYTSLLEGYGRGLLDRRACVSLLDLTARRAVARWGTRASLSLGVVAPGALGDERPYESPAQLAEDVAIATAAGLVDLSLFDLGGALSRPPLGGWLDALVAPPSGRPARSWRALALSGAALALSGPLDRVLR